MYLFKIIGHRSVYVVHAPICWEIKICTGESGKEYMPKLLSLHEDLSFFVLFSYEFSTFPKIFRLDCII